MQLGKIYKLGKQTHICHNCCLFFEDSSFCALKTSETPSSHRCVCVSVCLLMGSQLTFSVQGGVSIRERMDIIQQVTFVIKRGEGDFFLR